MQVLNIGRSIAFKFLCDLFIRISRKQELTNDSVTHIGSIHYSDVLLHYLKANLKSLVSFKNKTLFLFCSASYFLNYPSLDIFANYLKLNPSLIHGMINHDLGCI